MKAFLCEGGAIVLQATIPKAEKRPVECREDNGKWRAYYRVADENIVAHPLMVKTWRLIENPDAGGCVAYSEAEATLLSALKAKGLATVEELMIDAHLSQSATEDMIVRMAAMGLIGFEYRHPHFLLTIKD
jgi:hypothetical protein